MIGNQIAKYTIIQVLGTGGMGTVYLGENRFNGSRAAIKVLHDHLVKSEEIKVRFLREAKTQAMLSHPSITKVIDFVEQDTNVFIILEYIDGVPLDEYLFRQRGLLPEKEANSYLEKILDAVGYAHSKNVIHRDLKCANIMVTPGGGIKIMDFGIAKMAGENLSLTKTGVLMGSPLYMSPEQVKGGSIDLRSDIYALGVIYHEMLSGKPVYDQLAHTEYEIYDKILKEPLPRLRDIYGVISQKAQEVVDKATAKLPRNRFQSCAEFKSNLLTVPQEGSKPVGQRKQIIEKESPFSKKIVSHRQNTSTNNQNWGPLMVVLFGIILIGCAIYYFEHKPTVSRESVLLKKAERFIKAGDYRKAYQTYNDFLAGNPGNGKVLEELNQLEDQSNAYQERSVDSILQRHFNTTQLADLNPRDSLLVSKFNLGYTEVYNQLNALRDHPKVLDETTIVDHTLNELLAARKNFAQYATKHSDLTEAAYGRADTSSYIEKHPKVDFSKAEDSNSHRPTGIFPFQKVERIPIISGCGDWGFGLKACFERKVTEQLDQRIRPENYQYLNLDPGVKRCRYSFVVSTDGSLVTISIDAPHPNIQRDIHAVLSQLPIIKPGYQNNYPAEVSYSGTYSFEIPVKEKPKPTPAAPTFKKTENLVAKPNRKTQQPTSFEKLQAAAMANDAVAQNELANMYFSGAGIPKDEKEATYWYYRSAKNGNVDAQDNLGALFFQKKDYGNAYIWYAKAANANHAQAQFVLGYMYLEGLGVSKSRRNARSWWRKACQAGDLQACEGIKKMNELGNRILKVVADEVLREANKN